MKGDPFWQAIQAQGLQVSPVVAAFHAGHGQRSFGGVSTIQRGKSARARLLLWLAGFPPAGQEVPTHVAITTTDSTCTWERIFGNHRTRSRLTYDPTSARVIERFGPIRLSLMVTNDAGRLRIAVASMRLFGLPVPRAFLPQSDTTEAEGPDGRFHFGVSAQAPGIGPLISYRGDLRPALPW